MTLGVTVLASVFLLGASPVALAQNPDQLLAIAQSGVAKLADTEWSKLPKNELDCVNQKLGERSSVQSLAQRGIFPGDPLAAGIRAQCRSSSSLDQSPAQTKYAVDGLALGSRVKPDSAAYREYKCGPSQQFDGFTWCQKTRNEKERRGPFAATYSILHAQNGSVVYVNRRQEPSFLARNEADKDIQRYSREIGEGARITRMPHRSGLPDGMIALWGKTTLEPLDQDSIKILGEGKSPKKGLLVDFIGNFAQSAKEGLPIYRISGGAGFLWSASFDRAGRGTLRFIAADASGLSSPLPDQVASVVPSTSLESTSATDLRELGQAKDSLAESTGIVSQLDKEIVETKRQARVDTGIPDQEIEQTKNAERDNLDTLLLAQYKAQKASLDAKSPARGNTIIGLLIMFMAAALWQLVKSRRAAKLGQVSEAATIVATQAYSPESSEGRVHISDDQGDLLNHVPETQPEASLSELPSLISGSVAPENVAQSDGKQIKEAKPSKSFDEGEFVNQLAQTLGIKDSAGSQAS